MAQGEEVREVPQMLDEDGPASGSESAGDLLEEAAA